MKMSKAKKYIPKHEEGTEGIWAVSYSDLLMVLMSFFIVFFNMESKNEVDSINKLVFKFKSHDEIIFKDFATGKTIKTDSIAREPAQILSGFNQKDKEQKPYQYEASEKKIAVDTKDKFTVNIADKELIIDLPENLFLEGKFQLNTKVEGQLDKLLKMIEENKDEIGIVVIGHSDNIPILSKGKVINNNMALSTIRAANAVNYLILKGIDPNWVSAQGMGEYNRNTRSLSVKMFARK